MPQQRLEQTGGNADMYSCLTGRESDIQERVILYVWTRTG